MHACNMLDLYVNVWIAEQTERLQYEAKEGTRSGLRHSLGFVMVGGFSERPRPPGLSLAHARILVVCILCCRLKRGWP